MKDVRLKIVAAAAGLILASVAHFQLTTAAVLLLSLPVDRDVPRGPNKKRNRQAAMDRLQGFSDAQIKAHTGLYWPIRIRQSSN